MYEILEILMKEYNVKPYHISKATGIPSSVFTDWKKGRYTPKADKLAKIADYFGINVQAFYSDVSELPNYLKAREHTPIFECAAGQGRINGDYAEEYKEEEMQDSEEFVWSKVCGDSMYPELMDGEMVTQDTKTVGSQRVLAIPDFIAKDIDVLVKEHQAFPYEKTDYLIQDGFGQPMFPATFTNHLPRIEKANGLPLVSVHGLRHTFASMLNSDGVDIARISRELGHSNITTTLNVYTHVFGGATASSRGIAEGINKRFQTLGTNEAQTGNEKASEY